MQMDTLELLCALGRIILKYQHFTYLSDLKMLLPAFLLLDSRMAGCSIRSLIGSLGPLGQTFINNMFLLNKFDKISLK